MAETTVENTAEKQETAEQGTAEEQQPAEQAQENSEAQTEPAPEKAPDDSGKKGSKKKKEKKTKNPVPEDLDTKFTLRRGAKETKKYSILMRIAAVLTVILIAIIAVGYAISYFYDKFGSFTVKISKYDMVRQGLTLSETPDYENTISTLNANIVYDMTNISGEDLPENIDKINGSHNGDNYIAYTFYLINGGEDTVTYTGELNIESTSGGVDEAIRIAVYQNGEKMVYGKTKSNGGGKEKDCDSEFETATIVMKTKHEDFKPEAKDKYTVVIWLEGNDPDCTDKIIGGTMKLGMNFKIVENT